MNDYLIKKPPELSETEISTILESWDIEDWKGMEVSDFRKRFEKSEFHLLKEGEKLLAVARINFHFKVQINDVVYPIAELVGFVATEILRGYGKELLAHVKENLTYRKIESIGFCRNKYSPFYESCGFKIFYYKVKHLRERRDNQWYVPVEDDDIVSITLTTDGLQRFEAISDQNPAYLLFE